MINSGYVQIFRPLPSHAGFWSSFTAIIMLLFRYTMSHFRKDLIFQQATQAAKISYVVNMVSTSYVKVSQKHIMSRIAGKRCAKMCHESLPQFTMDNTLYRSGTVNLNTVNSKFHLIRSYCEIFSYHPPNIPCLKCTVNSNFNLIRSKILPMNDFELTVPNLSPKSSTFTISYHTIRREIVYCHVFV